MLKRIILFLSFTAWALTPSLSFGMDATNRRLCTEPDLSGTYTMVEFHENPKSIESAWYDRDKFHYFDFYPDHTYSFIASSTRMMKAEDLQKAILDMDSLGSRVIARKYTLDASGVLNLYMDNKLDYSYRCMVVTKTGNGLMADDLIFLGYSKQRTELNKHFRRWP